MLSLKALATVRKLAVPAPWVIIDQRRCHLRRFPMQDANLQKEPSDAIKDGCKSEDGRVGLASNPAARG